MNTRSDAEAPVTATLLDLEDEESFRQALQMLLTVATQQGVAVSNQSWKCVSSKTGGTWDVEITSVETETGPGR